MSHRSARTYEEPPEAHARPGHHVAPIREYIVIFAILMGLLVVTVLAALLDLGPWGIVLAYSVAAAKGILIVVYFMHLKHASRLTWIFAAAPCVWVALLMVLTFNDYLTRHRLVRSDPMTHVLDRRPPPGRP